MPAGHVVTCAITEMDYLTRHMVTISSIHRILTRDLEALRRELRAYSNEADIWKVSSGVNNSAGSLARHLTGGLSHFIGTVIGDNGYVRNREEEFGGPPVTRAELERRIDVALASVDDGLSAINDFDLEKPYPVELAGMTFTIGRFLIHLVGHFGYHLGQIDYHRRLVTGSNESVNAMYLADLK